jgi:hypothetical protein
MQLILLTQGMLLLLLLLYHLRICCIPDEDPIDYVASLLQSQKNG